MNNNKNTDFNIATSFKFGDSDDEESYETNCESNYESDNSENSDNYDNYDNYGVGLTDNFKNNFQKKKILNLDLNFGVLRRLSNPLILTLRSRSINKEIKKASSDSKLLDKDIKIQDVYKQNKTAFVAHLKKMSCSEITVFFDKYHQFLEKTNMRMVEEIYHSCLKQDSEFQINEDGKTVKKILTNINDNNLSEASENLNKIYQNQLLCLEHNCGIEIKNLIKKV